MLFQKDDGRGSLLLALLALAALVVINTNAEETRVAESDSVKEELKSTVDSPTYVREGEEHGMICRLENRVPDSKSIVRWYLNGEFVLELHDCSAKWISEGFCHDDPSEIYLPKVSRIHTGNYSCRGVDDRGLGPFIEVGQLIVQYPPGPAYMTHDPPLVKLGERMTLHCSVEDPGEPRITANSFKWFKGGHPVAHVKTATWNIERFTRGDMVKYTCSAFNEVGEGQSVSMNFDIADDFDVVLEVEPTMPIIEGEVRELKLTCATELGNRKELLAVRWYKNGESKLQLPLCGVEGVAVELCIGDPTSYVVNNVDRTYTGNYSCQGKNDKGWGNLSEEKEVIVHYPPGKALLLTEFSGEVKYLSLMLTCSVEDPGRPEITPNSFRWFRGGQLIPGANTVNWTFNARNEGHHTDITCLAFNEVGDGESDTMSFVGPAIDDGSISETPLPDDTTEAEVSSTPKGHTGVREDL